MFLGGEEGATTINARQGRRCGSGDGGNEAGAQEGSRSITSVRCGEWETNGGREREVETSVVTEQRLGLHGRVKTQTLNQLLSQLDGGETSSSVFAVSVCGPAPNPFPLAPRYTPTENLPEERQRCASYANPPVTLLRMLALITTRRMSISPSTEMRMRSLPTAQTLCSRGFGERVGGGFARCATSQGASVGGWMLGAGGGSRRTLSYASSEEPRPTSRGGRPPLMAREGARDPGSRPKPPAPVEGGGG